MDCDPQASLAISLGCQQPDKLPLTLNMALRKILDDMPAAFAEGICHHTEGVGLMPSNIELSAMELLLQAVSKVRRQINPRLEIDGILLTMVDCRTNYARVMSDLLRDTYGTKNIRTITLYSHCPTAGLAKNA